MRRTGGPLLFLSTLLSCIPGPAASATQAIRCAPPATVDVDVETGFRWRAPPGLERVARGLAESRDALRSLPGLGPAGAAIRGAGEDAPVVYLLEDLDCLTVLGLTTVQPDWVAGVVAPDQGLIGLRARRAAGDLATLEATFRHEIAHLALHRATGGRAPRWLQEGYAQYAAGSWDSRSAWRLRFVLFARGDEALGELRLGFPSDQESARIAYLLSYTAFHELASRAGSEGLRRLFARMAEGDSFDRALRATLGLTEGQFEERWRARVRDRYGILYLLSRAAVFWVLVTLVLVLFGWRRRRRDREKLERLRAEERAEAGRLEQIWRAAPLFVLETHEGSGGRPGGLRPRSGPPDGSGEDRDGGAGAGPEPESPPG